MIACPHCKARSSWVVDKRNGDGYVRRRRQCDDCGERFTSFETICKPANNPERRAYKKAYDAKRYAETPLEAKLARKLRRALRESFHA